MTYILSDPIPAAYSILFSAATRRGGGQSARGLARWVAIGMLWKKKYNTGGNKFSVTSFHTISSQHAQSKTSCRCAAV